MERPKKRKNRTAPARSEGHERRARAGSLQKGIDILKRGGLVAFPTETVYGLGAKAFDPEAVMKIFSAKGRPADNPLIVHVASRAQLRLVADEIPPVAEKLIAAFWPGPLTLVLRRSSKVPPVVSAGLGTVAVRCPDHPIALALIRGVGEPVAAPSANRSGRPSPTRAEHVAEEMGEAVDWILDGGPCRVGVESTVVDLTEGPPRILRPGGVTAEAIQRAIDEKVSLGSVGGPSEARSPGMKYRHYAPRFKIALVPPGGWNSALAKEERSGKRFGILCREKLSEGPTAVYHRRIAGGAPAYAQALFAALIEAEAAGVELLLVETVPKKGVGAAIMDRLERAAAKIGRRTIEVQ